MQQIYEKPALLLKMTKQKQIIFFLCCAPKLHQTVRSQSEHRTLRMTVDRTHKEGCLLAQLYFYSLILSFMQCFIKFYLKTSKNMNKIKNNLKYKKKYQAESTNQI